MAGNGSGATTRFVAAEPRKLVECGGEGFGLPS